MHPCPTLTVLAAGQVAELPLSLSGSASVLGFTSLPRVFANASGRIEFIIFLIMDWSFASGCSPPRLSATQLPSATDSQCSVRWGLPPHCWCALSGARGRPLRRRREAVWITANHGGEGPHPPRSPPKRMGHCRPVPCMPSPPPPPSYR